MSGDGALLADRYRVLRRLGSGGMGTVLLCRDERLHREVAVKRLHSASPKEIEYRFVREARLGASLNHPHLVTVFDTLTDDEGVLIVMEYVDGEALSAAIKRGPLPPEHVTRIATEVGSALDYAHDNGVVHRDVKPPNVLLRGDGSALLADLGIATAADETRITRSGTVLGSAAYMAPEQLDGHRAGPPADVYALGAVLFEALTGKRARTGRTPMEIVQDANGKPPPDLREHLPTAPAAAADVLRRALDRDPGATPAQRRRAGLDARRRPCAARLRGPHRVHGADRAHQGAPAPATDTTTGAAGPQRRAAGSRCPLRSRRWRWWRRGWEWSRSPPRGTTAAMAARTAVRPPPRGPRPSRRRRRSPRRKRPRSWPRRPRLRSPPDPRPGRAAPS